MNGGGSLSNSFRHCCFKSTFRPANSARTSIPPSGGVAVAFVSVFLVFFSYVVSNSVSHLSPTKASEGENVQRTVSIERRIPVRFPWVGARDGVAKEGSQFRRPLIGRERLGRRR